MGTAAPSKTPNVVLLASIMSFLPSNYSVPQSNGGKYFKPQPGKNKVRILTSPILGWQYWVDDEAGKQKPVRTRDRLAELPPNVRTDAQGRPQKPKHFWAMVIWDYATQAVCVWEITQASIQNAIVALHQDEDWGSPLEYNISITRKGEGLDTEYAVMPTAKSPVPEEALAALQATPISLEALYEGEDPFDVAQANDPTPDIGASRIENLMQLNKSYPHIGIDVIRAFIADRFGLSKVSSNVIKGIDDNDWAQALQDVVAQHGQPPAAVAAPPGLETYEDDEDDSPGF